MDGPRAPRADELDSLLDLLCEIWDYFPRLYSQEYLHDGIRRRLHRRDARIIVEDGRPVSNIQMLFHDIDAYGCRFKTASIGCVCTRADRRNRGFAGAILQRCLKDMTDAGARLLFVSGDRSLYRRNHCVHAGDFLDARLDPAVLPPAPPSLSVRRVQPDAWPLLAPLYQAEPVRFRRRLNFLQETCFWWDCNRHQIWLIESAGRALAYAAFVTGFVAEGQKPTPALAEYAGSRAALVDALPAIAQGGSYSAVELAFPAWDRDLAYLVGRLGAELRPRPLPHHTVRLLDLPGLMLELRPYLAARLPESDLDRLSFAQEGETCRFTCGEQTLSLGLSEAAPLVLGGPNRPAVEGDLGRVLASVFPLPLPLIGFEYI